MFIFRSILTSAVELGFRDKNPFTNVKFPEKQQSERFPIPNALIPEILIKLKETNTTLFEYCCAIYLTGLRPSDIINLKFENIVFIDGIKCLSIRESKNKNRNRGNTIIPIHPDFEKMFLNKDYAKNDYILKYPLERSNMTTRMSTMFNKKISTEYSPYCFRHTFITELYKAKVNETDINFLVGKLPEGTLKNYLKRDVKQMQEGINSLTGVYTNLTRHTKSSNFLEVKNAV